MSIWGIQITPLSTRGRRPGSDGLELGLITMELRLLQPRDPYALDQARVLREPPDDAN